MQKEEKNFTKVKRKAENEIEISKESYKKGMTENRDNRNNKDNRNSGDNRDNRDNRDNNYRRVNYGSVLTKELPISKYKYEILEKIHNNQVVIIAGETGCGKTTQVPQYIYEGYKEAGKRANILITQPRRIAAISIAKRLAIELNENLGGLVGYHVGMNPVFSQGLTQILIMTTGIFMQRFIHQENLDEYTHIILDEVHERDLDIDFVLVLIKHILVKNKNLRLILMSATIATHLFANYYSQTSICSIEDDDYYEKLKEKKLDSLNNSPRYQKTHEQWLLEQQTNKYWGSHANNDDFQNDSMNSLSMLSSHNVGMEEEISNNINSSNLKEIFPDAAPIIKIKEKIYPVKVFFLDTRIENETVIKRLGKEVNVDFSNYALHKFDKKYPKIDSKMYEFCFYLIRNINRRKIYNEPIHKRYHVLVFLPGFAEIASMHEMLLSKMDEHEKMHIDIHRLHSNLNDEEQEKVFHETDKRKIILSTNIAESSITINNVYYVIDFCLVKELKFNVRTNHQTLDLNWSSKASSNQRAGRAGRVGEGYVFRLVTEPFYNKLIDNFSSPEILRVPLEKIILRIKIWKKDEPQKILGRAIEPPNLKHIETAITNLQNYGALTLATENSPTGELTELGKVYSEMPIDIKYSRLIMLAYAFDLLEPAIVASSIMSQEKNIFKKQSKDHLQSPLYDIRELFSRESESDVVMFYNAFKAWEGTIGFNYHRNEFDRRLYNGRKYMHEEREFCEKYCLDSRVMKEVLMLNADLKSRLRKLNLIKGADGQGGMDNIINSDISSTTTKNIDFNNEPENLNLFRFIIAGAFFGNYIKCQYSDVDRLRKMKNNKSLNYKLNQAVVVRSVPIDIPDEEVKHFFLKFGNYKNLMRMGEEVTVEYDDITYKQSIKKILTLGANNKQNDNDFSIKMRSNGHGGYRNAGYRLRRPEHPFEVKMYDVFTHSQVELEHISINHVVLEDKDNELGNLFYVAEDYYPKGGKFIGRNCTKLPKFKMLDILIMLIFTPHATFFSNEEQNQYSSFRLVGSETEYKFTYLFSGVDVDDINSIRSLLNQIIGRKNESEINSKRELMKKKLLKLVKKPRIKIIANEEWWNLLYRFMPEKKAQRESNLREISQMPVEDDSLNNNFTNSLIELNPQLSYTGEMRRKIDKNSNDFLPPLKKLKIKEDFRLWSEEGIAELQEEMNLFNSMRKDIVKKIEDTKKLIYTDKAEIVCGYCNSYICAARNLSRHKDTPTQMILSAPIQVSGWVSGFVNQLDFNPENNMSDFEIEYLNENLKNECVKLVACKSNNHIIGIFHENKTYLYPYSKLRICFPSLVYDHFKEYIHDFRNIFFKEAEFLKVREKLLEKNLICYLCDLKFESTDDYLKHVDKDKEHSKKMAELLEEVFTEDRNNN